MPPPGLAAPCPPDRCEAGTGGRRPDSPVGSHDVTVTIIFALAAALANAVHLMTQHTASVGVSNQHRNWALVAFLIRQPLWLLGWAAAAGGFAFQAIALHAGQLSVVQALLVTELVFALVLRRFWIRQHIAKTAWIAALVDLWISGGVPHRRRASRRPLAAGCVRLGHCTGGLRRGRRPSLAIAARWGSPVRRAPSMPSPPPSRGP